MEQTGSAFLTNTTRALTQQAPYLLKLALDYESDFGLRVRLMYNGVGPRLVAAGTEALPDAYVQARHFVDVTVAQSIRERWTLRLMARNLANTPYVVTLGKDEADGNTLFRTREGAGFWLTAALELP